MNCSKGFNSFLTRLLVTEARSIGRLAAYYQMRNDNVTVPPSNL